MNIQNLVLDINKKPFQTITANKGEVGSRFIRITIVDNSTPVDLTGVTISLYAKKPDGKKVFNNVTVEDKANGTVLAELTSQILSVAGIVRLTLLLVKNGSKLASKQFFVNVDESIVDDEAIESTNEFTALVDALGRVNNIDSRFEKVNSQLEHNTNLLEKNNTLFKFKVYVSDYLKGDNTFRKIKDVDKNITIEQVKELNANATLDNSYDWYIIQKLINTSPDFTSLIFEGTYIIDLPLRINRSYLTLSGIKEHFDIFNRTNSSRIIQRNANTNGFEIGELAYTRDIYFKYLNIHGNQGTGVGQDANGIVIKGSCMNLHFNDCYIALWQNGLYHERGHFISSYFTKAQFSYCTKNGVYIKNRNESQANLLRFTDCGASSCGLKYEGGKWIRNTEFNENEGAGFNISGNGISFMNGASDICLVGICLNKGHCDGIAIVGTYFEANDYDIYVTHAETGEKKYNVSISGTMHVNEDKAVYFENELDRSKIFIYESLSDLHELKADKITTPPTKALLSNNIDFIYDNFTKKAVYTKKSDNKLAFIKDIDINKNYKLTFDYEYVGGSSYNVYFYNMYMFLSDRNSEQMAFISNALNRRCGLGNIMSVQSSLVENGKTYFTVDNINKPSDSTHLLVEMNYKGYSHSLYDGFSTNGGLLIPINNVSINQNVICINQVCGSNVLEYDPKLIFVNKSIANENSSMIDINGIYNKNGTATLYISRHKQGYPFVSIDPNMRINLYIEFNIGRLEDGQSLMISNFKCEEVQYPILDKNKLYNDHIQKDLTIRDSNTNKLIIFDGEKWLDFYTYAVV